MKELAKKCWHKISNSEQPSKVYFFGNRSKGVKVGQKSAKNMLKLNLRLNSRLFSTLTPSESFRAKVDNKELTEDKHQEIVINNLEDLHSRLKTCQTHCTF